MGRVVGTFLAVLVAIVMSGSMGMGALVAFFGTTDDNVGRVGVLAEATICEDDRGVHRDRK